MYVEASPRHAVVRVRRYLQPTNSMGRSVLLIDDEPGVLRTISRYFEHEGWEVSVATSGEEGVPLYEARRPDLVLLDLDLPGLSGLQILEILVSRGATVLMLTGHGDISVAVEAMQLGAESFLTKPVDFAHVGSAAERAVEKVELRRANQLLANSLVDRTPPSSLGTSPLMVETARQVELIAASSDTSVLLLGESGTGKTFVAQMIHARSPRGRASFVEINCAGLSATFLESELFGHEKGAFTGASEMKRGLFEVADRGTIFLDEIGDLSPDLQPKLLKVLETRTFRRLGGTREISTDVRLVAATHRDLSVEVREGRFREDLFYRLSVFPIVLPPLRERSHGDLLELVHRTLAEMRPRHPGSPGELAPAALDLLAGHTWPGNVRELRNALERALVLSAGAERIELEHLPSAMRTATAPRVAREEVGALPLHEVERRHIERTLWSAGGNRTLAAERLGISRATLHVKIKQYGMQDVGREE